MTSGLAIYDTMQYVRPEICTICMGQAASMGSLLLTAGSPDMRCILPNAKASEGYRRDYNAGGVGSTVSMKLPYVALARRIYIYHGGIETLPGASCDMSSRGCVSLLPPTPGAAFQLLPFRDFSA